MISNSAKGDRNCAKKKFTELAHSENGSSAVLISRVESVTCGLSPHVSNSSAAVTTVEDPYPGTAVYSWPFSAKMQLANCSGLA